jgi:CBS domain-containing protein
MFVQDILAAKGTDVLTIGPDATLEDVVQKLVQYNCGSLLVCQQGDAGDEPQVVGIITERDILRACAARRAPLDQLRVLAVMTDRSRLVTGSPRDDLEHTMGQMTEHRVRHLPILDEGRLCGLISIGDVVKAQHQQMAMENHYMKAYIQEGSM